MRIKNFLFVILLFATIFSVCYLNSEKEILFISEKGSYLFAVGSDSSNAKFYTYSAKNANDAIVKSVARGQSLFLDFSLVGEEYAIKKANQIKVEKNAKILFCEMGEWGRSEYYYCESIPYYKIIKGKKVNLQISYSLASVCIGSPMIFASY